MQTGNYYSYKAVDPAKQMIVGYAIPQMVLIKLLRMITFCQFIIICHLRPIASRNGISVHRLSVVRKIKTDFGL